MSSTWRDAESPIAAPLSWHKQHMAFSLKPCNSPFPCIAHRRIHRGDEGSHHIPIPIITAKGALIPYIYRQPATVSIRRLPTVYPAYKCQLSTIQKNAVQQIMMPWNIYLEITCLYINGHIDKPEFPGKYVVLTSIPKTMKNSLREISCPRIWLGAVSAMYMGAACIACNGTEGENGATRTLNL